MSHKADSEIDRINREAKERFDRDMDEYLESPEFVHIVRNGGRRIIHLTSTHADASGIRDSLNLIGQFLGWVDSIAEQLEPDARWTLVLTVAFRKLLRLEPHRGPIPTLIPV